MGNQLNQNFITTTTFSKLQERNSESIAPGSREAPNGPVGWSTEKRTMFVVTREEKEIVTYPSDLGIWFQVILFCFNDAAQTYISH